MNLITVQQKREAYMEETEGKAKRRGVHTEFMGKLKDNRDKHSTDIKAWDATAKEFGFTNWKSFLWRLRQRRREERRHKAELKRALAEKPPEEVVVGKKDLEQLLGMIEPKKTEEQVTIMPVEDLKVEEKPKETLEEIDTIRDIKWIYRNMGKLFIQSAAGVERLNDKVLKTAPSSGAIGLAHYALADKAKFYEKFVVKILPKDIEAELEDRDAKNRAKLDPNLEALEEYMKNI